MEAAKANKVAENREGSVWWSFMARVCVWWLIDDAPPLNIPRSAWFGFAEMVSPRQRVIFGLEDCLRRRE
jgi:hypothetical protein